jgi:hypothetical protein
VLILALPASACGLARVQEATSRAGSASDSAFRARDAALLREVNALNHRCAPAWRNDPECLPQACGLRTRELDLFAEVPVHYFTDITEWNYWHRGRLKFPGDLEQLLRRLAEESPRSGAPCPAVRTDGQPPSGH